MRDKSERESYLPEIGGVSYDDEVDYLAIGDIHGCFNTLSNLLKELGSVDGYNCPRGYKLISVGDLNNKGPHSIEVLNWAMDLSKKGDLLVVDSNHGRRLARRLAGRCKPGGEVERTFREIKKLNNKNYEQEVISFLSNLPAFLRLKGSYWGEFYVTHAAGSMRLFEKSELTQRERNFCLGASSFKWSGDKMIITGHVTLSKPTKEIHNKENGTVIRLDTGVNLGNSLSCYDVSRDRFHEIKTDLRDL